MLKNINKRKLKKISIILPNKKKSIVDDLNKILNSSIFLKDALFGVLLICCGFTFYILFNQIKNLYLIIESLNQTITNLNDTVESLVLSNELMQKDLLIKDSKIKELEISPEFVKNNNNMKKFLIIVSGVTILIVVVGSLGYFGTKIFTLKFLLPSSLYSFLQNNTFLIKDPIKKYEFCDNINRYVHLLEIKNNKLKFFSRSFDSDHFLDSSIFFKEKEDLIFKLLEHISNLENLNNNLPLVPFVDKINDLSPSIINTTNYEEVVSVVDSLTNLLGV